MFSSKVKNLRLKKKLLIILFCLLLGGFSGTILWFQVQKLHIQKQVKEQIEKGIDKDQLVLLKFTYAESETKLRWEHPKEFEYKQQMYDIVEVEYKDDSVYYWCWHDKEETRINNQIRQIAQVIIPANSKDKNPQIQCKKHSRNLYCETITKKVIHQNLIKIKFLMIDDIYSSLSFSPLIPPPKQNC